MIRHLMISAAALSLLATPGLANDTSAEMAAGGLVFTRNDAVRMVSEDLRISPEEVRVRYVFRNTTDRDVTVKVAFPMPEVQGGLYEPLAVLADDPQNLLAFATTVDGVPVAAQVEQKAMLGGVDHAPRLRALGVPLGAHLAATDKALTALPAARQRELERLGLVRREEWGDEQNRTVVNLTGLWTLQTTWWWTQTFPAGQDLVVEHRYQPAAGGSAGTLVGSPGWRETEEGAALAARYCIEPDIDAALARGRVQDGWPQWGERRVSYILKTGANWAGPIGEFRLTVDKLAPGNLVSFCADGVTKTSPTTFEVRKTDFTPAEDLHILVLEPYPDPE